MAAGMALRVRCVTLLTRVEASHEYGRLRAVYMDLAPLMGEIHGVVARAARERGDTPEVMEAQRAMAALRASARQVGFDLRLASPAALAVGLRTALEHALQALDALDRGRGGEEISDNRGS